MHLIRSIIGYGMFFLIFAVFMLPLVLSIRNKLAERRERKEFPNKIQGIIEKITADGKIEGPKGTYKPRRKHGSLTDHSTSSPKHSGYYHHPWS
jgi:hypothetical protein